MIKQTLLAVLTLATLAGCGATPVLGPTPAAALSAEASAKKGQAAPVKQIFNHLIGMISAQEGGKGEVLFEFGEQGLIFSDAVRKNPLFTLNGKPFEGGYGPIAGNDGKLYLANRENGEPTGYYELGSWEMPTDLAHIEFRQKVAIKLAVPYTYVVKKPLNPMAHITFVIDLKQAPTLTTKKPEYVTTK